MSKFLVMFEHLTQPDLGATSIGDAERHLRDVLSYAFEVKDQEDALVVYDTQSELSITLAKAYHRCLPRARWLNFDAVAPTAILEAFEQLTPGRLVVLIQSRSFRLDQYRIRLELFKRGLKVIEHPHLHRMAGDDGRIYIESLAYDPSYYRGVGHALKERIDRTSRAVLISGEDQLVYAAGLEPAKLNVGDYRAMKDVGGQFPIGEVFTESRDLEAVSGRVRIAYFGDTAFEVNRPPRPITLVVERGRIVDTVDATEEFQRVLAAIRAVEDQVWLRELGFGMNRAFSLDRIVRDIGTFERMCGVHLSLGAKHASYNKPNINKRKARHHVDVFVQTDAVLLDDERIYRAGAWQVEPTL